MGKPRTADEVAKAVAAAQDAVRSALDDVEAEAESDLERAQGFLDGVMAARSAVMGTLPVPQQLRAKLETAVEPDRAVAGG